MPLNFVSVPAAIATVLPRAPRPLFRRARHRMPEAIRSFASASSSSSGPSASPVSLREYRSRLAAAAPCLDHCAAFGLTPILRECWVHAFRERRVPTPPRARIRPVRSTVRSRLSVDCASQLHQHKSGHAVPQIIRDVQRVSDCGHPARRRRLSVRRWHRSPNQHA